MDELKDVCDRIHAAIDEGDSETAWRLAREHRHRLKDDQRFAWTWANLQLEFPEPDPLPALTELLDEWAENPEIALPGCEALTNLVDGRYADDRVEEGDPALLARDYARRAIAALEPSELKDPDIAGHLFRVLGHACRLSGPRHEDEALDAYRRAVALNDSPWWRFNIGLVSKTRGRFAEGLEIFRRIHAEVGDEESVLWNVGICATGCGDGETARDAWQRLGLEVTLGDDGLPRMDGLGHIKVRLSSALGGHGDLDDVEFEHVWAQRLSPCHARVLNPTIGSVGADYGDLVLIDGQSIGEVEVKGVRYLRFAALSRLRRGAARTYAFSALASEPAAIDRVNERLGDNVSLYAFDQRVVTLCAECARRGGDMTAAYEGHRHTHEELAKDPTHVIHGKVVVEAGVRDFDAARALRLVLAKEPTLILATPELHAAAGDAAEHARQLVQLHALEQGVQRA